MKPKMSIFRTILRDAAMLFAAMLTSVAAWAQDDISGLTYNSAGGYYEISSTDHIKALATYVSAGNNCQGKTFKMTGNINCSGVTWGRDYVIGSNNDASSPKQFQGTFDGDGHTISNINMTSELKYAGLFAYNKGTIKNITFENCVIRVNNQFGGIVAGSNAAGGRIENCTVSGTVHIGTGKGGGITGNNFNGNISNCYANVTIKAQSDYTGIIAASTQSSNTGTITNCYYTSDSKVQTDGGVDKNPGFNLGLPMYKFVAGTNVSSVTPTSDPTKAFGGTKYYAAGTEVTFNVTFSDNTKTYVVACNSNAATKNNDGSYTVTMPDGADATVNATEVDGTLDLTYGTIEGINATYPRALTEIKPEPTVKNKAGVTLTKGTDYTVEWTGGDFLSDGTYTVTVTGKGEYSGTKSATYQIVSYETMGGQNICFDYDTDGKYYKITSAADLNGLSSYVNGGGATSGKRFVQTDDITLTNAFSPIGTGSSNKFQGTYDGENKTISGLSVSGNVEYAALFGYLSDASVKNVILLSPTVSSSYYHGNGAGGAYVSALVGYMHTCIIDNCIVINPTLSATGSSENNVGVFIGKWGSYCSISNCYWYDSNTEHSYAEYENNNYIPSLSSATNVERVFAITADGCTAMPTPTVSVGGTDYYKNGTKITLSHTDRVGFDFVNYTVGGENLNGNEYTIDNSDADFATKWKKLLNHGDITIADIATQTYTGSALTPIVTINDGETTLTENTDYTITIPDGGCTNAKDYTVTITGIGNYTGSVTKSFTIDPKGISIIWGETTFTYDSDEHAPTATADGLCGTDECTITVTGAQKNVGDSYTATATALSNDNYKLPEANTTKAFTITPKVTELGALTLTEDQNGVTAEIDGNSTESLSIDSDNGIEVKSVTYSRNFVNDGGAYTIMLPFGFTVTNAVEGTFHTLSSIAPTTENSSIWKAEMSDAITTIEANKPYIFMPNGDFNKMIFENVTLEKTTDAPLTNVCENSNWKLHGVYSQKVWTDEDVNDYGFAAAAQGDIAVGEFVHFVKGASLKATRCYLEYSKDGFSKSSPVLPERIIVVFPDETASVVEPSDPDDNDGDVITPVSEIAPNGGTKVWSADKTIVIESKAGDQYRIIDLNGRMLRESRLAADREEVSLSRAAGIVVVIVNGKTFKVNY